ncbi:MAG TPA: hypothetical protein VK462_05315, partial [Nitrososphaeraceae archaeon]|nr:hypothetical protein [Nitrososphaeraceae archaeon]
DFVTKPRQKDMICSTSVVAFSLRHLRVPRIILLPAMLFIISPLHICIIEYSKDGIVKLDKTYDI